MKYYPYGDRLESEANLPTDRLFTGQRYDDTGLYYYGARYYDPEIGRFISPDTLVPDSMNPQSFNRYSYCMNNPLRYVDPSGHWGQVTQNGYIYIPGVGEVFVGTSTTTFESTSIFVSGVATTFGDPFSGTRMQNEKGDPVYLSNLASVIGLGIISLDVATQILHPEIYNENEFLFIEKIQVSATATYYQYTNSMDISLEISSISNTSIVFGNIYAVYEGYGQNIKSPMGLDNIVLKPPIYTTPGRGPYLNMSSIYETSFNDLPGAGYENLSISIYLEPDSYKTQKLPAYQGCIPSRLTVDFSEGVVKFN